MQTILLVLIGTIRFVFSRNKTHYQQLIHMCIKTRISKVIQRNFKCKMN